MTPHFPLSVKSTQTLLTCLPVQLRLKAETMNPSEGCPSDVLLISLSSDQRGKPSHVHF